jgi:putative ABC transport system permease protein
VALGPVRRAARITVRRALSDDVAPVPPRGPGRTRFAFLSRPLRLSLRSTFARRGRLALTVGVLAVGGAVFMSALNVADAWTRAVDADFARRRYDLTVTLAEAWPVAGLERVLGGIAEVDRAEYWPGVSSYLVGENGVAGRPISVLGPPPETPLIAPRLVAGRWLAPGDAQAAVVNNAVVSRQPGLAPGDTVRVRMRGRTIGFPVVGVVRELFPMPIVYAPTEAVLAATGLPDDSTRVIRLVTRRHDDEGQRAAAREIEAAFEAEGIPVSGLHRTLDQRQGILDHLVIIFAILTMASLVVVFVGGVGLTTTLALSVVQRTREIGILGAIGARPGTIARQVWAESMLIAALSYLLAMVLAAPVSAALETACGLIFLRTPLDFYMAPRAAGLWLVVVAALASLASLLPARRAARLPVSEALSHT